MALTLEQIRELVLEGESNRLDFKREQYHFVGQSGESGDKEKAKLIKDILAFANTSRTVTAFILIGVDEKRPRNDAVVGIPTQEVIDDADLQQFVNSKTNKPIPFRAYPVPCSNSHAVQVIEIAPCVDGRPFHLKQNFGGIVANDVWFRYGSSNTKATPDQICEMAVGSTRKTPHLSVDVLSPNGLDDEGLVGILTVHRTSPFSSDTKPVEPILKLMGEYPEAWFENIQRALSLVKVSLQAKNDNNSCNADNVSGKVWIASSNCNARIIDRVADYVGGSLGRRMGWQLSTHPNSFTLRPGECIEAISSVYIAVDRPGTVVIHYQVLCNNTAPIEMAAVIHIASFPFSADDTTVKKIISYAFSEPELLSLIPRIVRTVKEITIEDTESPSGKYID